MKLDQLKLLSNAIDEKRKKYRVSKKKKLHSRITYKYINNDQNFKALTSILKDNNSKIAFLNEVRYM